MTHVVFYQLSTKFLDNEQDIPEESSEVLYYALHVGHHTGIIDCLSEKFRCSCDAYEEVIQALPKDDAARYCTAYLSTTVLPLEKQPVL